MDIRAKAKAAFTEKHPFDTDHAQHREAEEYVVGCPVCEANEELRLRMNAETMRSRTSQPVQVEVTEELRERLANEVGYPSQADDYYGPEGDEYARGRANGYNAAFENVLAALGGGE